LLEAASSAARSSEQEQALARKWREAGYFGGPQEKSRAELFGRRLTSDAQGVDIGVRVPTYLDVGSSSPAKDSSPAISPPSWEPRPALRDNAADSLRHWGCVLLRGAVAAGDVAALREDLGLGSGLSSRRAAEVGQWLLQRDPNIAMGRYTFGRLHCLLRGSPEFEPRVVALHSAVAPLVHTFFREEEAAGARVFLSEAQLIVADPCAEAQGWHVENVAGAGLTVFVPLNSISDERGPQAILPGTHHLQDGTVPLRSRLRLCLKALCSTHGVVSVAGTGRESAWAAGDALVLDGRLLHRGLPNDSLGAPSAVLVLRYDLTSSPAPGCSRRWLLLMTQVGSTLEALFKLYAVV